MYGKSLSVFIQAFLIVSIGPFADDGESSPRFGEFELKYN